MFKHIKFAKWHGPYQVGQWARFPTAEANELIKSGKAVAHDPDKTSELTPKRASVTNKAVTK
jgi:hypothetical protein